MRRWGEGANGWTIGRPADQGAGRDDDVGSRKTVSDHHGQTERWLAALDRLIADSERNLKDDSAALLYELLELPVQQRWELFRVLDHRLSGLSPEDYQILFLSLDQPVGENPSKGPRTRRPASPRARRGGDWPGIV